MHLEPLAEDTDRDIVILHHDPCVDGMAAAYLLFDGFTQHPDRDAHTIRVYGANYNPEDKAVSLRDVEDAHLVIADYLPDVGTLQAFAETAASLTLLDHHATNIRRVIGKDEAPRFVEPREVLEHMGWDEDLLHYCRLDQGASGARLAWDFVQGQKTPVPLWVHLIENYDLGQFDMPDVHEFHAFMVAAPKSLRFYDYLAETTKQPDLMDHFISVGEGILDQQRECIKDLWVYSGHNGVWHGHRVAAMPCPNTLASEAGRYLLGQDTDADVAALYDRTDDPEEGWVVSLRNTDEGPNLSKLAERQGGGGHPNAAGFRCETLPWRRRP